MYKSIVTAAKDGHRWWIQGDMNDGSYENAGEKIKQRPADSGYKTGADVFLLTIEVYAGYIKNIISHLHNFGKYAHQQLTNYLHTNKK